MRAMNKWYGYGLSGGGFIRVTVHLGLAGLLMVSVATDKLIAQQSFTWQQIQSKFESTNPTLRAGEINVQESRTQEITAYLRPNPSLTVAADQIQPFTTEPYRPFSDVLQTESFSYLRERGQKRELRKESAEKATGIAESQQEDLKRTLLFNLRNAFVQTLQAKEILKLARENLSYYDQLLTVSNDRFKAGDMAQVDLDRLELQRVQFESDVETGIINLRTAKIQLLTLLNDRTPVDQFDVTGPFDFMDQIQPQDDFRQFAVAARPDLKAAIQAIDKAQTDHRLALANGTTDPTFGADHGRNPPLDSYIGFSVSIPLRIFDRNQGEKLRTEQDVGRTEQLRDATLAQVFSDVDSAYATLIGAANLLRPYKAKYLQQAVRVRDIISFSYQNGGASLLDFLNAQNDYRNIQRNYLTLIGSYLTAAAQLNLAVGREVIP